MGRAPTDKRAARDSNKFATVLSQNGTKTVTLYGTKTLKLHIVTKYGTNNEEKLFKPVI